MKRFALALSLVVTPFFAQAEPPETVISDVVQTHILPRFETLAARTQALSDVAQKACEPEAEVLRTAYSAAFDAWVSASHLRFGPTERDDRAFALAFWPDSRGATPRRLATLLSEQDPVATSVGDFAHVSIAARGFYALEFLLYDDDLLSAGDAGYHCQLVQTISADIALTASRIHEDWQTGYAAKMLNPTPTGVYRSNDEVLQEMFKSLSTGLEFTSDSRLGRPLGTFDRPRPTRAEARRSGRSSRHVMLSLESLGNLAMHLTGDAPDLAAALDASFEQALSQLAALNDPAFASVSEPQSRLKIEVVQQSVDAIRAIVRNELGPRLGVAAGFNALDGD